MALKTEVEEENSSLDVAESDDLIRAVPEDYREVTRMSFLKAA